MDIDLTPLVQALSELGITAPNAAPGPIGSTTPSTGAFTTLSASSTVSGAGFTAWAASPPAIGGTTPSDGAFTTLSATGAVSGAGITSLMAAPGPIGSTTPAAGTFTALAGSVTATGTNATHTLADWMGWLDAITDGTNLTAQVWDAPDPIFPVRSFTLKSNNLSVSYPVPTFRPDTLNTGIALDIRPNGTPAEAPGNGYAWIDVQPHEASNQVCTRVGITSTGSEFGNRVFGGAVPLPTYLTANGNTGLTVNPDGSVNVPFALYAGGPGNGIIPAVNRGAVIGWNYYSGAGEVDYWNGYGSATTSHTFMHRTAAGTATHLMDISPTGSVCAYGGINNTTVGITQPASGKFTTFGANSATPSGKITITGSRSGATTIVLASLLTAVATFGLITDNTTA